MRAPVTRRQKPLGSRVVPAPTMSWRTTSQRRWQTAQVEQSGLMRRLRRPAAHRARLVQSSWRGVEMSFGRPTPVPILPVPIL
jgi:hypothetical protein